ncbi:LysR family transcriptional regulator [Adlercreutzia equolifaciens]|uniref:LysR family transcriptional regulator n=1 Tax=Adlercreutzia equolifaciens TaxID=446660 RepID=UPI003A841A9D
MNIEALRSFVAVIEAGSISAAAKKLYISQQGLNKAVTALERELNVELVYRNQKGVVPTPAGLAFFKRAQRISEEYEGLVRDMGSCTKALDTLKRTSVEIHATTICMYAAIEPLAQRGFLKNAVLHETDIGEHLRKPANRDCLYLLDLFDGLYSAERFQEGFSTTVLTQTKIGLIASKEHFPHLPRTLSVSDARALPVGIYKTEPLTEIARAVLGEDALDNARTLTTNQSLLVREMREGSLLLLGDQLLLQSYQTLLGEECRLAFSHIEGCTSSIVLLRDKQQRSDEVEALVEALLAAFDNILESGQLAI